MSEKGKWNSSITRVRPIFCELLGRDPSGRTWLHRLMNCVPNHDCLGQLASSRNEILSELTIPRPYEDRVLTHYGIPSIDLPACFEHDLAPPTAFLRWLILNPDRMTWPEGRDGPKQYRPTTQRYRERLVGKHGADLQAMVQKQAQGLIDRVGAAKSKKKWWAFEGFTSVDCWLEMNDYILLIEGKRTEGLSSSTDWFPARNQLIRNLEAASEMANGKSFGGLLVVESNTRIPSISAMLADSLPHLDDGGRAALAAHYLGVVTWREICEATSVDYSRLPDTTADVVKELKC